MPRRPYRLQIKAQCVIVVGHNLAGLQIDHSRRGRPPLKIRIGGGIEITQMCVSESLSHSIRLQSPSNCILLGLQRLYSDDLIQSEKPRHDTLSSIPAASGRADDRIPVRLRYNLAVAIPKSSSEIHRLTIRRTIRSQTHLDRLRSIRYDTANGNRLMLQSDAHSPRPLFPYNRGVQPFLGQMP